MTLRSLRKRAKVRVRDVAKALGCDPSNICHIEAGRQQPTIEQLPKLAALYKVTVDQLLQAEKSTRRAG